MFTVEELKTIALALAMSDLDDARGSLEAKVDALAADLAAWR